MNLTEQFQDAQARVTQLPSAPDSDVMLQLYSLFKQGTVGDVDGKKPGMLDFIKKAKYEAWETRKGLSKEAAMQEYIELVNSLEAKAKK